VPAQDLHALDAPPSDMTPGGSGAPPDWACGPQYYSAGDGCDCGCGALDPDCGGAGCAAPGCTDAACDFCTDTTGQQIACPGGGGGPDGGTGGGTWTCNPLYQGAGDGCDCGCGDVDPDCGGGGCTTPGCSDPACEFCYDGTGAMISCGGSGGTWTCDPSYYGADDGCDCGCGIPDPDCFGAGCTEPGCTDFTCDFCYDASGTNIGC
jgi:hypothetical protein